ncbi:hypothetical protein H0H92_015127, partial [Tricholoma furcatifolium]
MHALLFRVGSLPNQPTTDSKNLELVLQRKSYHLPIKQDLVLIALSAAGSLPMATSNWTVQAEAEKFLSDEINFHLYDLPGDIAEFAVYALLY